MSGEASPASGQFRAWLELARISNAPTVIGNVCAGTALAGVSQVPSPRVMLTVAIACVSMYAGGMMLNDVLDADIDRGERPYRPIPSGRVSRHAAAIVSISLIALGCVIAWSIGVRALDASLSLAGAIVLYDLVHARTVFAVFIMGFCRAMVYVMAMAAVLPAQQLLEWRLLFPAACVGLYTAAFSLVARREVGAHTPATSRIAAWLTLSMAVAAAASVPATVPTRFVVALAVGAFLFRLSYVATRSNPPPDLRRAVLGWIAGFTFIDAALCTAMARYDLAGLCIICCIATKLAHRRILGT